MAALAWRPREGASCAASRGGQRSTGLLLPLLQGKLLTVGSDGEGLKGVHIKGWAVEGLRPGATPAVLASPARLLPGGPASKAASTGGAAGDAALTAVALHCSEWPTAAVALGLSSGAVHMLRADVAKSKVTAPVPAAHLHASSGGGAAAAGPSGAGAGGITALHFAQAPASSSSSSAAGSQPAAAPATGSSGAGGSGDLHLFAVAASRLAAFDVRSGRRLLEDECGAAPGCSAVSERGELLLAGPDAVYSYTGGGVWGKRGKVCCSCAAAAGLTAAS